MGRCCETASKAYSRSRLQASVVAGVGGGVGCWDIARRVFGWIFMAMFAVQHRRGSCLEASARYPLKDPRNCLEAY